MPTLSEGLNITTPVRSCKEPGTGTGCCADLVLAVGRQKLGCSTGDGLGYRMLTLDVSESRGLTHYPLDRYIHSQGSGQGQGIASQLSKLFSLEVLRLSTLADATLDDTTSKQSILWDLGNYSTRVEASRTLGLDSLDSDMLESVMSVGLRLDVQAALPGWVVTDWSLTKQSHPGVDRSLICCPQRCQPGHGYETLELELTYERSAFTKAFAIFLVVNMTCG